jgi:hypothetical protein
MRESMLLQRNKIATFLVLFAIVTLFLAVAYRSQSPRHVRFDFANWRVYRVTGVEFSPDGDRLRTTEAQHLGPVTISSQGLWKEEKPNVGTNLVAQ